MSSELWPLTSLTHLHMCLRLVSQSWHAFVDDSVYSTKIEKLNCKRQRISGDKDSNRASSSNQYKNGSGCDKEVEDSRKLFLDAKKCLYLLKRTLEDLQKKDLFPYNPKPLLRRSVVWPWVLYVVWYFSKIIFLFLHLPLLLFFWHINSMALST